MKKIAVFLVVVLSLLAARWLFKSGYFVMHDDLQMMRQLEMEKCFADRQIPCRWVPDMGFGYGYPLFNFYPPMPYYFGQIFRWLSFSFVDTAKILFILQFLLSGLTMFLLGSEIWGIAGGLLSAVFYVWAPYRSVDVFVRGAMNEAWSFVWFPLILWSLKKLIDSGKFKHLAYLSFSFAMLLTTHSIMAVIFVPAMIVWTLYWLYWPIIGKKLNWSLIGKFFLSAVWAIGLAAFFTLPMFFEQKFVHIETMFSGHYDWRAHFVSIKQMFLSRFWGYGPSTWGIDDGMPFPVGQIHWILGVVILIVVFFRARKKVLPALLVFLGIGYAFLAHQRSVFIWRLLPFLQMAQFPWRLLTGAALFLSLAVGYLGRISKKFVLLLVLIVVAWNWSFFRPEKMGPLNDAEKFSGEAWRIQQVAAIYDYLPKSAYRAADNPPAESWQLRAGKLSEVNNVEKGTNWFFWQGVVEEESVIEVNIIYFPGWKVWLDGKLIVPEVDNDLGTMKINLPKGQHKLNLRLTDTPIRSWANLISLVSWWLLLFGIFKWKLTPKKLKKGL